MKIGIDIGGSHIAIGVINEFGEILEKIEKRITYIERKKIEESIETYIIENILELCKKYEITKIGMSIPGWAENGIIKYSGNLGVKNDYNIIEELHKKIDLPITIRNDAKCAALAEKEYGCLKNYENGVFLTLGTGIGGAAFWQNKLLNGNRIPGYEFGHMVIEKEGIPCQCGRIGCFERYASMKAFKNNLRSALNLDEATRGEELLEMIKNNNSSNENYEIINNVVEEYITNLSIGILNLINIFEPEKIGIGGSFVYFEDVLLPKLKEKIQKGNKKVIGRGIIEIQTAVLGNDAGIIGSVLD